MVSSDVVFALVVRQVFLTWVPPDIIRILRNFITNPKISHFHCSRSLLIDVLFAIPTAVALSQRIGVFGWGWPNSSRVNQKIMPSLQFRKRAPSSASAAEATTKRRMAHNVKNAPFNLMGLPSFGVHPMKKWPHALLRGSDSDKYDASECTFMIMSDAQNRIVAFGYVSR